MKQRQITRKRHELKPEIWRAICQAAMPIGDGETPTRVIGWSDRGRWTRIEATYPNGFILSFGLDANSQPVRVTMRAKGLIIPSREGGAQ